MSHQVNLRINNYSQLLNSGKFILIAGPCVIESRDMVFRHAEKLKKMVDGLPITFFFKSSYAKSNRSAFDSFTGVGIEKGLMILEEVRKQLGLMVCSDVHETAECQMAGEVLDILQIPAFLSRQTSLLIAAGLTGRIVEIKKGQMLSAHEMCLAAEKVRTTGNPNVILAERGTFLGYNDHVVDFRNIPLMQESKCSIIYDATHSLQSKTGGKTTGGQRRFLYPLMRAAIAVGVSGIFAETHENPNMAKSDVETQIPLNEFPIFLEEMIGLYHNVNARIKM